MSAKIKGALVASACRPENASGKLMADEVLEMFEASLRSRLEESLDPTEASVENTVVVELSERPVAEDVAKSRKDVVGSAVGESGIAVCFTYVPDVSSMADLAVTLETLAILAPKAR